MKNEKTMDWDDIRFFLAVARNGGLSGAAGILKSSPATISRRLNNLEHSLNVKLFSHSQQGYALTDEGEALIETAEAAEASMLKLQNSAIARSATASGHVRLATAENIANQIIIPNLPEFYNKYPDITLDLHTAISSVNLTRREADIALRLVRPQQGNVTVKKLGEQGYGLYGNQVYIKTLPKPDKTFLKKAQYIHWAEEFSSFDLQRWLQDIAPNEKPFLQTHSLYAQLTAVRAGLGLAILPCFLAHSYQDLVRIPSPIDKKEHDIWLVTHQDLRHSGRINAVATFLEELVKKNKNLFTGDPHVEHYSQNHQT